ncbi:sulfonate ABC transporter substrate-binding protein [Pseudomonas sp. PB120]|uniref:sulfonate ABC transporter substrate-binding protein n=1 Tax=Pseudomonas sp. PB120 TaxID=2494700 RepID=UPI0012FD97B7|nr:sulfonate ABC transporter substrate-binding protein [Pseudomonas sp. PB120]MVV48025.1 sulfonate ABC transporter substrate-binding protein [Pseudomonas sp. PB120]
MTLQKLLLTGLALMSLTSSVLAADPATLRIGYQKGSISLLLAKEHGLLEKRFPQTAVQWIEFPAGPQMLEAMNVNALDIGSTGDIPPLFAQAAGADLVYIGTEPPKPQAETILVKADSPLKDIADLKGKKVAFQRGSSSHNLILRALNKAGLNYQDIQPMNLPPANARAAFEQGSVDAWVIWEPYSSLALSQGNVRVLANGEGLNLSGPMYTARRAYAQDNGAFIHALLDELTAAESLTRSQREDSLSVVKKYMGLPGDVIASYLDNRPPSPILPVDVDIINAQQLTADLFYQNKLLPTKVVVRNAVWTESDSK